MICYPYKLRARLFDERIQVLRELQCLANGETDDRRAAQLGQQLTELDAEIVAAEQVLDEEKKLAVVADGNRFFSERAMSVANGIARRADFAMAETMNPTFKLEQRKTDE